jgi:endonuclease/exonuclease/phosphatase family metal-dependent hydrolase
VKILSYNIWNYAGNWPVRRQLLVDIMRTESPDVVALQEVRHNWRDRPGHNQARWLAERLGYHWVFRPAHMFWHVPPVVEGLAFLSREPLEDFRAYAVPRVRWAGPDRVILTGAFAGLRIFNVHFPLTERARVAEARQLVGLVINLGGGPALAVGDFNADADQAPMRMLDDAGFIDLWDSLEGGATTHQWPSERRIDYALACGCKAWKGTIRTVGTQPDTAGLLPSDHPGLIVNLENIEH